MAEFAVFFHEAWVGWAVDVGFGSLTALVGALTTGVDLLLARFLQ